MDGLEVSAAAFADDIYILKSSEEKLQANPDKLKTAGQSLGLTINARKPKL